MTRRGLFKTLFGGIIAAMGFRPRKTWMVPIFYKREVPNYIHRWTPEEKLIRARMGWDQASDDIGAYSKNKKA